MKKIKNVLLIFILSIFVLPINIFATDVDSDGFPIVARPADGIVKIAIPNHMQGYGTVCHMFNESSPYFKEHPELWGPDKEMYVSGKLVPDDDSDLVAFKRKKRNETDLVGTRDGSWRAFDLKINSFYMTGLLNIRSTDSYNTETSYPIWPEQFGVYITRKNKEGKWEEPIKLERNYTNDTIEKTFYISYLSNPGDYEVKISFDSLFMLPEEEQWRDEEGVLHTFRDSGIVRIYTFMEKPKEIPRDLLPGNYKIPLIVRYFGTPGRYSMASQAVEKYGNLIVEPDRSMKLRMTFKPMTISDSTLTGGAPVNGHLENLWTFNTLDDFQDYLKNGTLYSGNKISLDNSKNLLETYTENGRVYPKTYEIPLVDSEGNPNYEAKKMFDVRVDAMGTMDPTFDLLMDWEKMTFAGLTYPNGKYEGMPILSEGSPLAELWENGKFKISEEENLKKLEDITNDVSKIFDDSQGVSPYYRFSVSDSKVDLDLSYVKEAGTGEDLKEYGLVKINDDKPIKYKAADGKLYNIEVLEETPFKNQGGSKENNPDGIVMEYDESYEPKEVKESITSRITKIRLKNIPISMGLNKKDDKIFLTNCRLALITKDSVDFTPGLFDGYPYSVMNIDAGKVSPIGGVNKATLQEKINEAKAIKQGKKTDEAFDTLKAAITSAEGVLNSATEQTAIDEAVTTLNKAIETFKNSPEKQAPLNKTDLDAKIKDAEKISQGKKSEDAFKTLKAAIEAAKSVLNSANTQEQIKEALTTLNKAIDAFSKSADVNVTPGASEKVYTIPVKLMHSVQDKESMGNKALISPAKVSIKGDDVTIDLTFKGIEVPVGTTKFYGHLTNLFSFEGNTTRGRAIHAEVLEQMEDKAMDGFRKQFPKVFRIKLTKTEFDNLTDNTLYVKVWVDAMDGIAGGGPGSGAQNARLVFDKSKMTEATPGGLTPTPPTPTPNPPIPTPDLTNRTAVIDALRSYSNFGGPQYTYQSNMRYVNAYNSLMNLLSKPVVTESEVKSAIDELKSAAAGLVLDTSKSNNSGNNQGWGNNNQGWGNNNQGWGNNNQGWGNNNQNNNQNNQNNGPVTIQYEVPVEVLQAYQSGYSMANAAINHTARVEERNGQFRYSVNFHSIQREFGGKTLTGNLTNLFIVDGSKYRADQSGSTWSWIMNGKYDRVNVAVWVDAMDEIAGKGPGGGEQNAILSFNWNGAKEVGRVGGNNNQQNQQAQSQSSKSSGSSNSFTDINGHWAKQAIDYVVGKGYFFGLSNAEFGPNKSITRGQFVTVLGRMLNVNTSIYSAQNFNDVKSSMYYSSYIAWANKMGIVSGVGQGRFAPDKELTREEMAVIMSKFLKVSNKSLNAKGNSNGFMDDGKIESWAKEAVKEMAKLGVVNGMGDGKFAPKSPFTRAQVAQVLFNIDHN